MDYEMLSDRLLCPQAIYEKCTGCKWHNMFWENSGCAKRNDMERCKFEQKEAKNDEEKSLR